MSDTDGDGMVDDFAAASMEPATHLRGCGVIIRDTEGRVLLMQRGPLARHEQYKWEIPGGACEAGETFREAAVREVREELGVEIVLGKTMAQYNEITDSNDDVWQAEIFEAVLATGELPSVQEPGKCVGYGWFAQSEVAGLNLADYVIKDFRHLGWL